MQKIVRAAAALLVMLSLVIPCFAETLIPGGEAVGLELTFSSICIMKTEKDGAAEQAGLQAGDCIVSVDRKPVRQIQSLLASVETGRALIVGIRRSGKEMTFTVRPQKTAAGWRIGAEVVDCIDGIGTITYFDPVNKTFGALGHGVNLPNTKEELPVNGGAAYAAEVSRVEKSESGDPGELKGTFSGQKLGNITVNSKNGIFGTMDGRPVQGSAVPVAETSQTHPGDAVIRCCVNGTEIRDYSVQILEVYPYAEDGRDLLLKITDQDLLTQTGGIVRGMSGSPIIQDGRLVGAVTHVLVDNPVRGYGIFIENMLAAAEEQQNAA